jgi:hypothetical protein
MSKIARISITLTVIFILTGLSFVSQANAITNYYSNNFESTSALDDGYWSLHDAEIQTLNNQNTLKVTGEASFNPEHGDYALDNFTVQFDVWHNVVYENNTAYAGSFYEASDSENNAVITMGYVQRGTNDILTQQGFLEFNSGYSHYYFPFGQSSTWSTWRLTATTAAIDNTYFANITLQVDGETITNFTNDREQTVSEITNEWIMNPVAYHNLLPLPQPGVVVPTYAPTLYSDSGIHYDLMSNIHAKPVYNSNGATPSYIDNFYYGYADTVPLSIVPTPTSNGASSTPTPTPTTPEFPFVIIATALLSSSVIATAIFLKRKRDS